LAESLFIATTAGLEGPLEAEARALGEVKRVDGGLELSGAEGLHRRANLELRTASRVMRVLARLHPRDPGQLRAELAKVDLAPFTSGPVALDVQSARSRFGVGVLKAALPARWRSGADAPFRLRAEGETVVVSVDTSGELLYRRGYRQETSHAPLRETLAAGLLMLAGYDPSRPLWDPMCGSGTIAIEAAWLAQDRAPGLSRSFAFERWPSHDAAAWEREKAAARARIRPALPAPIHASDLNAGALGVARRNARRAEVGALLELSRHDATKPRPLPGPGLVIANLPYGKRVGAEQDLEALYAGLGRALAEAQRGWTVALFAEEGAEEGALGITWSARHRLENGGIRCVLRTGPLF